MTRVAISANVDQLDYWMNAAARDQIPFAMAVALTRSARSARDEVRSGLGEKFVTRSKWVEQGVQFTPARKRDWPGMSSVVGSRDAFMERQELGGTKHARSGRNLAIPTLVARGGSIEARIPASQRPKRALKKRGFFLQRLVSGRAKGSFAILRRDGRERYPLQVLYLLKPSGDVHPHFGFVRDVTRVVRAGLPTRFQIAMRDAMAKGSR